MPWARAHHQPAATVCLYRMQVNLICFNPFAGTRFRASPMEQVLAFRSVLIQGGRVCTIRDSRGDDEMAACGQLGNPLASAKSAPILEPPERFRDALAAV
jgi:23S rRNA (adenine2503-C2)-methyltransferase